MNAKVLGYGTLLLQSQCVRWWFAPVTIFIERLISVILLCKIHFRRDITRRRTTRGTHLPAVVCFCFVLFCFTPTGHVPPSLQRVVISESKMNYFRSPQYGRWTEIQCYRWCWAVDAMDGFCTWASWADEITVTIQVKSDWCSRHERPVGIFEIKKFIFQMFYPQTMPRYRLWRCMYD